MPFRPVLTRRVLSPIKLGVAPWRVDVPRFRTYCSP
jgi:hypothetical protein